MAETSKSDEILAIKNQALLKVTLIMAIRDITLHIPVHAYLCASLISTFVVVGERCCLSSEEAKDSGHF